MIPPIVSHYEIGEKIGEGGMGEVYLGRDTRLNRKVAIKVLPAKMVADPDRRERFETEARSASALNHPNIVTVYDIVTHEGADFLVLELVEGRSLDETIGRNGLRVPEALRYAVQIAGALAAAHGVGIIHRDVKPANVMVTEAGTVKVLDFGLAKLVEPNGSSAASGTVTFDYGETHTVRGEVSGTAAYMSPEQAEGRKVDVRSDVFSFGALLYEMLTGRRAFPGDSPMRQISAVLRDEPEPLGKLMPDVPRDLDRLVQRCLRKDPARRWQTMADLKVALEELREEVASGSASGAAAPAPSRRKRSRWTTAAAVLAVLAAGAGLGAFVSPMLRMHPQPLQPQPLTTYPGLELFPTFSPDGNQVAFAWNGEDESGFHIYVKLVGPGEPLQLTRGEGQDSSPAWSADGQTIAFVRREARGPSGVYTIPALGGPERFLANVASSSSLLTGGPYVAWHPDGRHLAVVDRKGPEEPFEIAILNVEDGTKGALVSCPDRFVGDLSPAFSPDGQSLAFSRYVSANSSEVLRLDLTPDLRPAGEPVPLVTGDQINASPTWAADGRSILFSSGATASSSRLFRVPARADGRARPVPGIGEGAAYPAVSRSGQRLAYTSLQVDVNIWRYDLDAVGTSVAEGRRFLSSTLYDGQPEFSPDGKRVVFESSRSGTLELWVADADGHNAMPLTNAGGTLTGNARWSPDAQWIAYEARVEGQGEIFVVSARGGKPRQVTNDPANDSAPSWSGDGKWIYFTSNRNGSRQVWKVNPEGGKAIQVTQGGGTGGYEGPDGSTFYYTRMGGGVSGIWRVPVNGGEETQVWQTPVSWQNLAATPKGLYFLPGMRRVGTSVMVLDFATGKVKPVRELAGSWIVGGLTVSPDGRTLLVTRADQPNGDLMLVENFR